MFPFFDNISSFTLPVIRSHGGSRCYLFRLRSLCCSFFFFISFAVFADTTASFSQSLNQNPGDDSWVATSFSCPTNAISVANTSPQYAGDIGLVRLSDNQIINVGNRMIDPSEYAPTFFVRQSGYWEEGTTISWTVNCSGEPQYPDNPDDPDNPDNPDNPDTPDDDDDSDKPWARESTLQSTNTILSQLNIALDSISNYTSVVPFIHRDLGSFFTSFSSLKSVVESMASDLSSAATDTASIKTDAAAIKTDVASIKTDAAAIKTDVASIKSDAAAIKTDVASIKSDTSSINSTTASIKSDTASINNTTTVISTDVKSLQSDISSIKNTLIQNNPSPTPPTRMDRLPVPSNISALDQIKRKLLPPRLFSSSDKRQYVFEINFPLPSGQSIYIRQTIPFSTEGEGPYVTSFDPSTVSLLNDFLSFFRSLFLVLLAWCFVKAVIKTLRQW